MLAVVCMQRSESVHASVTRSWLGPGYKVGGVSVRGLLPDAVHLGSTSLSALDKVTAFDPSAWLADPSLIAGMFMPPLSIPKQLLHGLVVCVASIKCTAGVVQCLEGGHQARTGF